MNRLATSIILAVALFAPVAAFAQTIPVAIGGERSSLVGLPFDLPITVDMSARSDKLGAFALRLQWNPAVLQMVGGQQGTFGSVTLNTDSIASGVLRMAGVNATGASGLITAAIGRFLPLTADTTTMALSLSELFAAGTYADLLPSATTSSGLFCPARGMFGDIDGDGNVNSRDALFALTSAVGLPTPGVDITLGDVDANGATNARDALVILSAAVGLDVSGFRVMRIAGGSCTIGGTLAMSIAPGPLTLLVGQQTHLEARAADSLGALQAIPGVAWKSSASAIVAVLGDGTIIGRDSGSAVVTAVRGTTDSAQVTITVAASRTRHIVDAAAITATVTLGSAAYPFGRISDAMSLARAGDTIEIRPGRYDEGLQLDRDVVIMGDTLADGSRPLINASGGDGFIGADLIGSGHREIQYLAFQDIDEGVEINGPASVLLRGITTLRAGTAVEIQGNGLASLRVETSTLIGTGQTNCCGGNGIDANVPLDTLVIDGTEIGDFYDDAVYAYGVDSLAVRGSRIHDLGSYGFELGGSGTPLSLAMDSSLVARAGYEMFYVQDLRSAVIEHSALLQGGGRDDIFYQYQEEAPTGGYLVFRGDSLDVRDYHWLDVSDLDSVVVDSSGISIPDAESYFYNVAAIRVNHSRFWLVSSEAIYVEDGPGVLEVRNSSFAGDPNNDQDGYGIEAYETRTLVDSSTFTNFYEPIYSEGDSGLTVTHSSFHRTEYPIEWYGNWYVGCVGTCVVPQVGAVIRNNVFNSFYDAIDVEYGWLAVDSNTFIGNNSDEAIYMYRPSYASVTANTVSGASWPIEVDLSDTALTANVTGNVLTDVGSTAIYVDGQSNQDAIHARFLVADNQVDCVPGSTYGVDGYHADLVVTNNQLTGCSSGIRVQGSTASPRSDSIIANTVSLPPGNPYGGITLMGNLRSRVSRNSVTADTAGYVSNGMIYATAFGYGAGTVALVDSNTVTGGQEFGIGVYYMDTALIAVNTVTGVKNDDGEGAIALAENILSFGAVVGNTVRHAYAQGITLRPFGAATLLADSNMVSGSATGIDLQHGPVQATRNTLTGNALGMYVHSGATPATITGNNIFGNTYGMVDDGLAISVPDNWWGDPLGPRCQSIACDGASTGDSVATDIAFTPVLAAANPSTPPPSAPRAFASAAVRAPAVRALPTADIMPAPRTTRPAHLLRAPAVRSAPSGAQAAAAPLARQMQAVASRRAAMVERWSEGNQQRSARDAALLARRQARAARMQTLRAQRAAAPVTPPVPAPARARTERRP